MKHVGIPLILTFRLDSGSQALLDEWRASYFPPSRNYLKAHLTIYHQLPGQKLVSIQEALQRVVANEKPTDLHFDGLKHHQGFVGITLSAPGVVGIKERLDLEFKDVLRAQDRQGYRPHITVTNLGSPGDAKRCYDQLSKMFIPWTGCAVGLDLYHYHGGPWEHAATFLFEA